jgi:hypothetical protein
MLVAGLTAPPETAGAVSAELVPPPVRAGADEDGEDGEDARAVPAGGATRNT